MFVSNYIWLFSVCELSLIFINQKSSHHLFFKPPSNLKGAFLELHLSISNDIVSTKKYDKRVTTLILKL